MKTIHHNHRSIIRAIRFACIALALGSGEQLVADPVYTTPYYTLNGSAVKASGTSSTAYFNDTSDTSYTVDVRPSANLSNATANELEIGAGTITNSGTLSCGNTGYYYDTGLAISVGNGSVTNRGTVTTTGSGDYNAAIEVEGGTVINSGTITAASGYGILIGIGTVSNEASGVITSAGHFHSSSAVYIGTSGTLTNAGKIASTSGDYAVQAGNSCTIKNTGSIYGGLYLGVSNVDIIRARSTSAAHTAQNSSAIVFNSGSIDAVGGGGAIIIDAIVGHLENTNGGVIHGAIDMTSGGILSNGVGATIDGECYFGEKGGVDNAGTTDSGIYIGNIGKVTNTGSLGSSTTQTGIEIVGQGTVHNSGTINSVSCGVLLHGNGSSILTSGGTINSASAVAIDLTGQNSSVTVAGQAMTVGTIEGTNPANNNVLHFRLTGLTTAQAAAFETYVSGHTNSGSYTFTEAGQPVTYKWENFANVTN